MRPVAKFFKLIIILTILCAVPYSGIAQTKSYKLDDLKGKTWVMQGLTDKSNDENYEKNQIISYLNGNYFCTFEYYLSNSIDTVFDSTRVGAIMEGKYIVKRLIPDLKKTNSPQPRVVSVFEIIDLSPNKLVIRNTKQQQLLEYKLR